MTQIENRDVSEQALELAKLQFNWNGSNSEPVEQRALDAAREFLTE